MQQQTASARANAAARSKWPSRIVYLLLLAAAVAFVARLRHFAAPAVVDLRDVQFERLDGSPLPPQTLQGKAVVLNFWAPWCPPCRVEMPWIDHLQKSDPNIVVLGVEDDPEQYQNAISFAGRKAITYPLVRSSQELHQKLGQINVLPTTLFISRSGHVVHAVTGALPEVLMRRFAHDAEQTP